MARSTRLSFEIAAVAVTATAMLAVAVLATRLGGGLAITTSVFTTFFCVFVGIAVSPRDTRRRDSSSSSIKDELEARKIRASGSRVQFR
ncbi:MAG TPA: hypothetical protein VI653_06945 [Steroidobacteraceae bacterium]